MRAVKVGVMGAGSVGCYLGGVLANQGMDVVLVGRSRTKEELATHGFSLIDLDGRKHTVQRYEYATDVAALRDREVVLCCVKSGQTEETGKQLASVLPARAVVASMQNGVRNAEVLRRVMPEQEVLRGIVGFNVLSKGEGIFRQATSGLLVFERTNTVPLLLLERALHGAGLETELSEDVQGKQWSKLLMNLNNALSALSGEPTRTLLFEEGYRKILAALIEEGLSVLRAAKIEPARLGVLPVGIFPAVMRLPTPVFRVVARTQLRIDPEARSSMWEDLSKGRLTEVDELNGEVVRLASACGVSAPRNAKIVELVHEAERAKAGPPGFSAERLQRALGL